MGFSAYLLDKISLNWVSNRINALFGSVMQNTGIRISSTTLGLKTVMGTILRRLLNMKMNFILVVKKEIFL